MTRTSTADPLRLVERLAGSTPASAVNGVAKPAANGSKRPTPIIIYPTGVSVKMKQLRSAIMLLIDFYQSVNGNTSLR